jgi:hypothetical protein
MTRLLYFLPSLSFGAVAGLLAGLALGGALTRPGIQTRSFDIRTRAPDTSCTVLVTRPRTILCAGRVYVDVGPATPMPGVPAR